MVNTIQPRTPPILAILVLSCFAAAGTAQQKELSVAVYNQNLGFIKEIRSLQLQKGTNRISLTGLPESIDPNSVHTTFDGSAGTASVVEQQFEYDLIDANKLLSRYIGRPIEIITTGGDTIAGRLLNSRTDLVVELDNGEVKLVRNREAGVIGFPGLPESLKTEPTLNWIVESERSGRRNIEIQYLTQGMSWSAEYMAVLNEKDRQLNIKAWVNVDNQSGKDYMNSDLKLVAGDLNLVRPAPSFSRAMITSEMKVQADVSQEEAFEYYVYTIGRKVDLPNNQSKQIALFDAPGVKFERQYVLNSLDSRYQAKVRASFKNDNRNGLGTAFPAGRFRVYTDGEKGDALFIGEDRIAHRPVDEQIQVNLGVAFDIIAERKQVRADRTSNNGRRESYEIKVRNHKDEDVTLTCVEVFRFRMNDSTWKIVQSSAEYQIQDSETAEFTIHVPAGKEGVLVYAVEYSW